MELVEAAAGLRPGTPDNLPRVERAPLDGLVWATGHYRNGILLAPLAAREVVDLLGGGGTSKEATGAFPARSPFQPRAGGNDKRAVEEVP
jgi:glycine oxidase